MTQTSRRANEAGYALLDAIVSIFIVGILCAAVYGGTASALRRSGALRERAAAVLDARNTAAAAQFNTSGE